MLVVTCPEMMTNLLLIRNTSMTCWGNMSQDDDQHAFNTQDFHMLGATCPKMMTNMSRTVQDLVVVAKDCMEPA
jgi:hypothetical protein